MADLVVDLAPLPVQLLQGLLLILHGLQQVLGMEPSAKPSLFVSEEKENSRKEVCNSCESKKVLLGVDMCSECNCVLALKTKATFAKCPIGKW
jgi:hypothetical protein